MRVLSCVLGLLLGAVGAQAQAYVETILHTFTGGADGSSPYGLVIDKAGNLYGTTPCTFSSCTGGGTVFKLTPQGVKTILATPSDPNGPLFIDKAGNLYGTTLETVYKVTAGGKFSTLHTFGRARGDGAQTTGSVFVDSAGNIYGMTSGGGRYKCGENGSCGTVYKITPSGKETVLYSFGSPSGGAIGTNPGYYGDGANLLRDGKGNLYGATVFASLFKLTDKNVASAISSLETCDCTPSYIARDAKGNFWGDGGQYTLYSVSSSGSLTQFSLTTGIYPTGPLMISGGNVFGTTYEGGNGFGTVYSMNVTTGVDTNLYSFNGGSDSSYPVSGVVMDSAGNLYGTTTGGETDGFGTIFKLSPTAAPQSASESR